MQGGSRDGTARPSDVDAGTTRHWARRLRHELARVASGLARHAENRRLLRDLGAMSDRELRDIGLTRQDAADAGQLHPAEDVSGLIVARQAERRAARRVRCGTGAGVAGGGVLG